MARNQINITLGTAGHIDHGKTALIKCLTGCETDRLKEEKERGMSIELGYAPCTLGDLEVGIVDVPGHEQFIRTMVAGAGGMDACMLVVAADDGPMPQTREHLDILTLLDVRHGLVVLTKIDRIGAEELKVVREVVSDFLKGTFLEHAPIMPVSNVTGEGLGNLYDALRDLVASIRPRPVDGLFRLPVERAFSIHGHGTVIAGVPISGSARVDDEVVLLPDGLSGRIKSIQVYGQESPTVKAGQCAAINIRHWDHRVVERGKTLTLPGWFEPQTWCVCHLRLLAQDKLFLKHGASVKFHTGTSERLARVYFLEADGLHGGRTALVQFRMDEPLVCGPRDRFIIRDPSPPRTIGGGIVIETLQRRLNRNEAGLLERLDHQREAVESDQALVRFCAAAEPGPLVDPAVVAHRAKVPVARSVAVLGEMAAAGTLLRAGESDFIHADTVGRLGRDLVSRLAEFHQSSPERPGLPLDEIRQSWDVPGPALQAAIERLKAAGRLTLTDQRLALAEHRPTIADPDARNLARLESIFQDRPFNPPETGEISAALAVTPQEAQRLLRILLDHRKLVRIDRDLVFHKEAVLRARELIINHVRLKGRLESVEFKYLLDTSRKFAIPLLDYFDRTGVTKRTSDNTRLLRNPEVS
jgi:selenocysteine-specific elongation factor